MVDEFCDRFVFLRIVIPRSQATRNPYDSRALLGIPHV